MARRLDVPGGPHVIHAPGHTPGSAAFFLEQPGVLFTGDAFVTKNVITGARGPQAFAPKAKLREAIDSLSRLEAVRAELILPGHGAPWRDGVVSAMAQARMRALG